jgi:hypothetical protein
MHYQYRIVPKLIALVLAALLVPGQDGWSTVLQEQQASAPAAKIPAEQLDSLVAPIALYPDPLLSQTLVASTYPLEIVQLQQWLAQNKNLKDKALADAAKKQDWDPSIQAMAALPDLVKQLAENIKWTTDLGNAFLAQQTDVMDAIQRMRAKAKDKGNLKSSEQQKVETKVVEKKEVIVIQPSTTEVIYVPSYNPTVVYGAPVYAYPPIYYPPPGYYAAGMAISFGVGVAMGAAWGGCCGWGASWGGNNDIYINRNNTFVNNSNRVNNIDRGNRGNTNWQHNPQHRGGAPYGNRQVANRYGGTTRGDSISNRQASAQQNINRSGGSVGTTDRGANRASSGGLDRGGSGGNQLSSMDRGGSRSSMDRGGSSGISGADRAGNRSASSSSSRGSSAFGGGGASGNSARASSSRGSSSMRGGGSFRGGGGRRR